MIQSGEGDDTVFPESHVVLVPETRFSTRGPSQTTVTVRSGFTMQHEDRDVVILNFGRCATASDAVVWLPTEKILITGRLCDRSGIAATSQSDTSAWRGALYDLLDLEPAIVIPGHGAPGGPELLAGQLDRLTGLRTHVENSLLAGMSEDRAVAGYDAGWFQAWKERAPDTAAETFRPSTAKSAVCARRGL